ncbi:YdeI family protein [Antrihabitans sp. NCIMB 15449]|uniref:YdeI family protein n=1 Tax=Antrihabitans spumae TaxID=3373370 RepID=A0ABW7JIT1_9NOCA
MGEAPMVHAETREQWRTWLVSNHKSEKSDWLGSWKKATGKPAVSYDDAVSEALAVGWVDSRPKKLDDERTMLYCSPRKPTSKWSRPNKIRIDALRRDGLMLPAGEEVVQTAVANGSWTALDQVEDLVVPEDLSAAFAEHEGAEENWGRFPRSARRGAISRHS